jgi:hypothetical protein
MTLFVTCVVFLNTKLSVFALLWLVFGYAGVFWFPAIWLLRTEIECVEFSDKFYRHYFPRRPRWFTKIWPLDEKVRIEFGEADNESISTLCVRRGCRRDIIAYWANDAFRRKLFDIFKNHLLEVRSDIEVHDFTEANARERCLRVIESCAKLTNSNFASKQKQQ